MESWVILDLRLHFLIPEWHTLAIKKLPFPLHDLHNFLANFVFVSKFFVLDPLSSSSAYTHAILDINLP